jgi:hypothetical protein
MEVTQMLYSNETTESSRRMALLRFLWLFDGEQRRRRRVETDLLSLSPYLRRDIGFPCEH